MISNEMFLEKARALEPTLNITEAVPPGFERIVLGEGGKTVFDFGTHYVGHIRMELAYEGSHPDAPLWLKVLPQASHTRYPQYRQRFPVFSGY